jgi:hypothetical protein
MLHIVSAALITQAKARVGIILGLVLIAVDIALLVGTI